MEEEKYLRVKLPWVWPGTGKKYFFTQNVTKKREILQQQFLKIVLHPLIFFRSKRNDRHQKSLTASNKKVFFFFLREKTKKKCCNTKRFRRPLGHFTACFYERKEKEEFVSMEWEEISGLEETRYDWYFVQRKSRRELIQNLLSATGSMNMWIIVQQFSHCEITYHQLSEFKSFWSQIMTGFISWC